MYRWVSTGALVLAISQLSVAGAQAQALTQCGGDAEIRGGSGQAAGQCDTTERGDLPPVECDPASGQVAYYGPPPSDWIEEYLKVEITSPHPEGYIYAAAYNCAGRHLGGPFLIPDPDWPGILTARNAAKAEVTPVLPPVNVSPSDAVVGVATWLWVDDAYWSTASATRSSGAASVRVEARPTRVTWSLDEGSRVCSGPGIPWTREVHEAYEARPEGSRGFGQPACTFTFRQSSSTRASGVYEASVTVTWEFSWWLGGSPQGAFGTLDQTTPFDLRVGEVQALVTDYS